MAARTFRNLAFLLFMGVFVFTGPAIVASKESNDCFFSGCHCTGGLVWCEHEECPYGYSFCQAVQSECAVALSWCDWGTTCEAYCEEWLDGR